MYKVAVMEDEEIIRKGLLFSVPWAELDCTVVADCADGEKGMQAIREHKPDIVITDINMPVVDGLEMIRRTCEEQEYSAIIISGYSDFEYAQTAIRYGVLGYLLKPIQKAELREAIERACRECAKRAAYQNHSKLPTQLKEQFLAENPMDYRGDDRLVQQMLDFVRDNYSRKILMSDLESALNYSDTFLNKKFKEAMGTTFMEYVNRYRIHQAIRMMTEEGLPVQETAWRCGIGEYKYFRTVFKKYLGCSPKEFLAAR
ncbi:MAG: response regulator [Clostridiales bacterium]|nr:response regulator [Clostridiales bacterium]